MTKNGKRQTRRDFLNKIAIGVAGVTGGSLNPSAGVSVHGSTLQNGTREREDLLLTGQNLPHPAQTRTFSSTPEYRSMLDELHHDPARPSRMGAGTLLVTPQPPVSLKSDETAAALHLRTRTWRLEITKSSWQMSLKNNQTGLTWQLGKAGNATSGITWKEAGDKVAPLRLTRVKRVERHGDVWQMQVEVSGSMASATLEVAVITPTIIRLSVRMPRLDHKVLMGLNFGGRGPFFGLGERFGRVKLDGLKTILHPEDLLGQPGHNWTYIPVPFLFTPRGLGIYLDTAVLSMFDLSRAKDEEFSVQVHYPSVDAYLFVGDPEHILEDYTFLTGRTPVSPPWAFGVWICSYQGPQRVMKDARRLRRDGIPASAIWTFDVMGKGNIMGWPLWWTGYYPNIRKFTDQLHSMGFKVLTYVHPYLRSTLDPYDLPNSYFEDGKRTGLFVLNSRGEPTGPAFEPYLDANIDFTSPANVNWWEQKIREIVVDDNFDGWMEDFGEWVNDTDHFSAGVTGHTMANLNPLFYHKITYEIARKFKPDIVEFDRSGYAGSQGYTRVVWGGDQLPNWSEDHGLPSVVKAGITAGLSGFGAWGPDIDGNGFSKELWTRWVQFGALTPIMRNHLWDKPKVAVNIWFDQQTTDTFRRYAKLHMALFPYFYTYAHKAAKTGLPIIRHLMFRWPNDPNTYDVDDEYLLGEKILVAPVIREGATTRSLYLPKGSWVDYWTGQLIDGGYTVEIPAPLERIPILLQAGSIIPLISPETVTLAQDLAGDKYATLTNNLRWRIFPASGRAQDTFTLYDGTMATVWQGTEGVEVRIEHSPILRQYEVILPPARRARRVTLDRHTIRRLDEAAYRAHKTGWWLNTDDDTLHVSFSKGNFELKVIK